MLPGLMDLLPGPHNRLFRNADAIKAFLRGMIAQHKDTCDWENPKDFIDNFLVKMKEEEDNPDSEFNEENLLLSTFNIFLAGTDTTSSTLRWGLLLLLKYPQIQERIQREMEEVVGTTRSPVMADRKRMPYTDAVIHEIQRYANIIPLNLPHVTTRDTQFRGFTIPKGL
uniref:Cytochrome P450 2F2-like n=1 Tax=Callorhinchus milii TaxID=7868 RepID=A0A4W3GQW0_CALMI